MAFRALVPLQPISYADRGLVCAPRSNPELGPGDLDGLPLPIERLEHLPGWPRWPARLAGRWYVRTAEHAAPPASLPSIVLADGDAFGAIDHRTTALALDASDRLPRGRAVDVGCGAGLLSLAWAIDGRGPVTAIDIDPAAIDQTSRSAEANRLDGKVTTIRAEIGRLDPSLLDGAVLLANLPPPGHAALLTHEVHPRAIALGGIGRDDARRLVAAWSGRGLRPVSAARSGRFEAWVLIS